MERSTAKMHGEKKEIRILTTRRADMKSGHIKREQIKNKKVKRMKRILRWTFFWTETKGSRQKKQDIFQKRSWQQRKIAKCFFWRSCVKNKLTRKTNHKKKKNNEFFFF